MIINKKIHRNVPLLTIVMLLLLSACGGNKKEMEAEERVKMDSLSRPENISMVSAIARVEPANGLIDLSAEVSGLVVEIYKKEGDSVKKGEPIFKLDKKDQLIEVDLAKQQIITQQSNIDANKYDINQYEATLREKEQDLSITRKLAETGADTRQNLAIKQKERDVLFANLQSERARLQAGLSELKALKTKLQQSELDANNRVVSAKENGILVSLDPKIGTAITAFSPFATLATNDDPVLYGEIDEMFADRVKIGQELTINYLGTKATIAKGKIIYISPILDNKSLFYEKTGETTDRRVRKFKAKFTTPEKLLINAKVECKIKIQ
ncbi:efflux RND transporter periplasmic adaptor subunit [Pedobacter gandavensis]|uniref:HlyD family secretion protein n=1 Tax=Pedobacter gandavensis TaxID=2679963 RepID=UPI002479EAEA|nr:efflux RND transporter periplasmic adaptor subunit [Pedobacter gandavensis]WGQ09767.1 efflux RND transporter periplasmic adaptor subunit [Pedobacter gandavensis]